METGHNLTGVPPNISSCLEEKLKVSGYVQFTENCMCMGIKEMNNEYN